MEHVVISVIHNPYITLTLMALVVYLMRSSGYWLAGRVTMSNWMRAWLGYVPSCLMISIITPLLLYGSITELLGALTTAVMVCLTRSVFVAMLSGILVVCVLRVVLP
ncbi:MAG: hypothetical protein CL816_05115 [Coxiellaceae bacterium]|nr:hypothetical protein [Coxiellaceae bacterium]